ncbi:TetR/AcrR family transcriptional regulator [Halioxenophilus sp. WMMB6]|uniref:TetR/AcrR family transcriptional regulator n=1 Tax=Halioxenophilus sp. WMMB6 TaxID=3073815 RepID=UPI00295E8855|nr:TetR/AcrR family transcriptional regulator [Halioxenophilus sp. WMMB6]
MTSKPKAPRKKRYVERPDARVQLLDAAEALIRKEGYAAATARRIAGEVGLKHQVVFYYFGTQEELLLALYQRVSAEQRERIKEALNGESPLKAIWNIIRDPEATRLSLEFMALANHSEVIRAEIAKNAEELRELESEAIARLLEARGITEPRLSPRLVSMLTNAIARLLVQESTLGISLGHEEAEAMVDASLAIFESGRQSELDSMSPPG